MAKYLPGDHLVAEAQAELLSDLKKEFMLQFASTHKKLDRLAIAQMDCLESVRMPVKKNPNKSKIAMKQILAELEAMSKTLEHGDSWNPSIARNRFNNDHQMQLVPADQELPMQKWQNLAQFMFNKNAQKVEDVLKEDFIVEKQENLWQNVNNPCQKGKKNKKMNDSYYLQEVLENGESRFLVVKNPAAMDLSQEKKKLEIEKAKQQAKRNQRIRKLSHRAQRKAMLKEITPIQAKVPMSYSDIVKRNLKLGPDPMEDIFEAWRDFLLELDCLMMSPPVTPEIPDEAQKTLSRPIAKLDKETIFASWRNNLDVPDQPELRLTSPWKQFHCEDMFAGWRHNFEKPQKVGGSKRPNPESCFEAWRIIFNPDEKGSKSKDAPPVHPEAYFQDWLANLQTEASDEGDVSAEVESEAGAALKNKKRAQRKSQNLKKKRH